MSFYPYACMKGVCCKTFSEILLAPASYVFLSLCSPIYFFLNPLFHLLLHLPILLLPSVPTNSACPLPDALPSHAAAVLPTQAGGGHVPRPGGPGAGGPHQGSQGQQQAGGYPADRHQVQPQGGEAA